MGPKDGGGSHGADFAFEAGFYRAGLLRAGNDGDDFTALQDLFYGHRDGARRNFGNGSEPAFVDLLSAAGLVELDDQVRVFGLEVGWGVVERQVAVFADSDECDVDWCRCQFLTYRADNFGGILFAVEQVIAADAGFSNKAFHQIFAETGGVVDRKANVLIEVEHFDARPVDAGSGGEELEEIELRGTGGGDDAGHCGFG